MGKIGFIGLGAMGRPMASNLARKGFALVVHDVRREPVEALAKLGAVAGNTDGIAPGLELDLGWRRLAWYVEAEYLFDLEDRDDDFFYSWSTLTYGFTDWLSAGLVTERSKLVDTDFSLQHGLALEITSGILGLSLYTYNLGSDDSYSVVALALAP